MGSVVTVFVQDLPVQLKSWHDLDFIHAFGRVFRVFDHLISGNLCFGVENEQGRFFIKYAGAPTINYLGYPEEAIERLQKAAQTYQVLAHPAIPPLLGMEETPHGLLCVFPWLSGFPLGPLPQHFDAMRRLSVIDRLAMLDPVFSLLALASQRDYIAAGLADNHLLVDFQKPSLTLCSVDDFVKMPCVNARGRLPGAPWYLAPEAYHTGASLDEGVTVYAMGALAMTFLGDRDAPSPSSWCAAPRLYEVAKKALSHEKTKRFPSAQSFLDAWRQAVRNTPFS